MKLIKTGKSKRLAIETVPEVVVPEVVEEVKPKKKKSGNKLPSDEYRDEITPIDVPINESGKIVVSVKRGGEFGLPKVDIRFYSTTEVYTGFTKKGVNFDLVLLPDLIKALMHATTECYEEGLYEEFEGTEEYERMKEVEESIKDFDEV